MRIQFSGLTVREQKKDATKKVVADELSKRMKRELKPLLDEVILFLPVLACAVSCVVFKGCCWSFVSLAWCTQHAPIDESLFFAQALAAAEHRRRELTHDHDLSDEDEPRRSRPPKRIRAAEDDEV